MWIQLGAGQVPRSHARQRIEEHGNHLRAPQPCRGNEREVGDDGTQCSAGRVDSVQHRDAPTTDFEIGAHQMSYKQRQRAPHEHRDRRQERDGNACPRWQRPSKAVVAGDAKCRSIAAASIVAKVTRDRIMAEHAETFPGYGWETNRGYPTPEHIRALDTLGLTPLHRRSFAPVRERMTQVMVLPAE